MKLRGWLQRPEREPGRPLPLIPPEVYAAAIRACEVRRCARLLRRLGRDHWARQLEAESLRESARGG